MSPAPSHHLGDLLAGLGETGDARGRVVTGLTTDSRRVAEGDLFIARPGARFDAGAFIGEAARRGAVAVVCPRDHCPADGAGLPLVAVEDIHAAAGEVARRFFGDPAAAMRVLGITGTNGKTSVSQFVARALAHQGEPAGVIGTLGYGPVGRLTPTSHTTPDVVELHRMLAELRDAGMRYVAVEVSSHGLEQRRLAGVTLEAAAFTNLSHDHLDYHRDMEAYARAKARIFEQPGLRSAVVNMDDHYGRRMLAELANRSLSLWGFGLGEVPWHADGAQAVRAADLRLLPEGLSMTLDTSVGRVALKSRLFGAFNASNLLAAAALLLSLGMPLDGVAAALADVEQPAGRMERFGGGRQPLVVVDYAHTPDALAHALQALRPHCDGRLWCVFGCGGDRDRAKRPLMGEAAASLADHVVITDDNPRHEDGDRIVAEIRSGMASGEAEVIRDRRAAIRRAIGMAAPGDIVLVAGKGHEDYQQVGDTRFPFADRDVVPELLREVAA